MYEKAQDAMKTQRRDVYGKWKRRSQSVIIKILKT